MDALLQASGVKFGILKSQSKNFRSVIFWKRISTAPTRNLKARDGRPLVSDGNLFWNSIIAIKNFQVRDFLERDSHGATRNLKARAGRHLVTERSLFWNSKIAIKSFQVRDFLERDFHGANKEP